MTITVLSQYLYHVTNNIPLDRFDAFLKIIYLIEATDYHKRNLDKAQILKPDENGWLRGSLERPNDWKTSLGLNNGDELNGYWSNLVSIIEFEAFIYTIARLADIAFVQLNSPLLSKAVKEEITNEKKVKQLDSIPRYLKQKHKYRFLQAEPCNRILEDAWRSWLEDLVNLRHVIVHKTPFGGRTWSCGSIHVEGVMYNALLLPNFKVVKERSIDTEHILKVPLPNTISSDAVESNSKTYSDYVHGKTHKLIEDLIIAYS